MPTGCVESISSNVREDLSIGALMKDASAALPYRTLSARRSVLAADATSSSSVWDSTSCQGATAPRPSVRIPDAIEIELLAVLSRPLRNDETHRAGFDNIENEAYPVLARLDPPQSASLLERFARGDAQDPMVAAFQRLVSERRTRVQRFLASVRRRQACSQRRL